MTYGSMSTPAWEASSPRLPRALGRPIPPFDFSVPGVSSMSADLHKYGFTAKGASTFLLADQANRKHQVFEFDDWSRGHYSSPTIPGTRPGGPIAAAWAVLNYLGWDGYVRIAGELFEAVDSLKTAYVQSTGYPLSAIHRSPSLYQRRKFLTRGGFPFWA